MTLFLLWTALGLLFFMAYAYRCRYLKFGYKDAIVMFVCGVGAVTLVVFYELSRNLRNVIHPIPKNPFEDKK